MNSFDMAPLNVSFASTTHLAIIAIALVSRHLPCPKALFTQTLTFPRALPTILVGFSTTFFYTRSARSQGPLPTAFRICRAHTTPFAENYPFTKHNYT